MNSIEITPVNEIKLGIIGLGLIGQQRVNAALKLGVSEDNIVIFDPNISVREKFSKNQMKFVASSSEFYSIQFDRIIIGTPHNVILEASTQSLETGALVLLEKPMGRNLSEARSLFSLQNSNRLSIGFNYRFMPGVVHLKELLANDSLGSLTSINLELGHGGSPQDKKSWKLSAEISGGGALLDPGIHLIDLLLFLFDAKPEDIKIVGSTSWRGFWDTGIDESVSVIGYIKSTIVQLNISLVWWRTQFKISINGTEGYFELEGRGRSDGPQKSRRGKRWAWVEGISQIESETTETHTTVDESFVEETFAWLNDKKSNATAKDGLEAMIVYDLILGNLNE